MRRWFTAIALMLVTGGLVQARLFAQASAPVRPQVTLESSKLRGFVVALALGEIEGGKMGSFPAAATKALADLKDFLPYKSYRPLDTVWILGLNGPNQFLRGADGRKHEFHMRSTLTSATGIKVEILRLWDTPPAAKVGLAPTELLIDTDFSLSVGETVVVGTSRLDDSRGLILLVTAAPR